MVTDVSVVMERDFFVILDCFSPFHTPNPKNQNSKNQNFGQMNNTPEDIIILQMYTINECHMMYGSCGHVHK